MRTLTLLLLALLLAGLALAADTTYTPTLKFTAGAKRTYTGTITMNFGGDSLPQPLTVTLRETVQSYKDNLALILMQSLYSMKDVEREVNGCTMVQAGGDWQIDTPVMRNKYGRGVMTDPRITVESNHPPVNDPKAKLVDYFNFDGMTLAFPAKAIKVGDSWSLTGTIMKQNKWTGIYIPAPLTVKYTLSDVKEEKGHTLLVIKSEASTNLPKGKYTSVYEADGQPTTYTEDFGLQWSMQSTALFDLEAGEIASESFESNSTTYSVDMRDKVHNDVTTKKGSYVRDVKADDTVIDPANPHAAHMAID